MSESREKSSLVNSSDLRKLIIIGSSAGGPKALRELLSDLDVQCPVVIVQHMPKFINKKLSETLANGCKMSVKLAEHGEKLQGGTVYIAPSDYHLKIRMDLVIELVTGPMVNYVCPAIDVTMQSISVLHKTQIAAVILTGMGKDGAAGISHLKNLKALTIAQEASECSVSSMPDEARKTGHVDKTQNLKTISFTLNRWANEVPKRVNKSFDNKA